MAIVKESGKKPLKAYEDIGFLKSDHCRPARLQLEFLKPEVTMEERRIESTIVLFGSARTQPPEVAQERLEKARKAATAEPDSPQARGELASAQRMVEQSRYYKLARQFAGLASQAGQIGECSHFVIVTGGGGGIMEAGNRGAADVGGHSVGLNISLPYEQMPNPYISEGLSFQFHYFSIRKMHFLLRAKALAAFPGGFGTMDEVFETLTLIQTGKIKPFPVVLFGREFWQELINWDLFVERGLIAPQDLDIFRFCETAEEAWEFILTFWQNSGNGPCGTLPAPR